MSKEAMKLALEALDAALSDDQPYIEKSKQAITALREALADQPAQQETIKQGWDVDTLLDKPKQPAQDVPEVGFGNTALDKMAENARELGLDYEPAQQEPEIVQRVKRFAGKTLRTARNPNITARECIELANWIVANTAPPAAQRTWVWLTNNELQPIADEYRILFGSWVEDFARAIEAKLRSKNEDRN